MSLADELRTAGLVVIEGRSGRGRTSDVESIDVELTSTGQEHEGADDINSQGLSEKAVAYIERSGRVWLLADGPLGSQKRARVVQAAYREPTEEQEDATAALLAVLEAFYDLGAPSAHSYDERTADDDTAADPEVDA